MRGQIVLTIVLATAAVALVLIVGQRGDDDHPGERGAATLADYWGGKARWVLEHKWTAGALAQQRPYDGAHLEVVGDRWYLFNRRVYPDPCPTGLVKMGVQVRESSDRGSSWSAPVPVVEPAVGTEWACSATDGDMYYDAAEETWRYLFQCLDDNPNDADGDWNACYVERRNTSPMGAFSVPEGRSNPVLRSGELWHEICDPGDDCAAPDGRHVDDEGTFNIFGHDDGEYWIGFHGFDGVNGYRGIAKTPDFSPGSFTTDNRDEGLPEDAILDRGDAASFRERWVGDAPVGAGAGTIVAEDGMYYALNEFADVSLNCTDGQNWNLGIFRSRSLTDTTWEPFQQGNPIVLSSRSGEAGGVPRGCNVLYPNLFRDPATATWYLMHGRSTADPKHDAIYLYRLERDVSLLENADFWRGDTAGWSRPPNAPVNVSVYRDPNGSPDGTPYAAFNCGESACAPGASIYQDVQVGPGAEGDVLEFGATLRAEHSSGIVTLAVHQLDAAGRTVHTDSADARVDTGYSEHTSTITVRPGVRRLRVQLYPRTPQNFAADNLFLARS